MGLAILVGIVLVLFLTDDNETLKGWFGNEGISKNDGGKRGRVPRRRLRASDSGNHGGSVNGDKETKSGGTAQSKESAGGSTTEAETITE